MEPRLLELPAIRVAGLEFAPDEVGWDRVPALFYRLAWRLAAIPHQAPGSVLYGYIRPVGEPRRVLYLAGVEVTSADGLPSDLTWATIPAHLYACTTVHGGLAAIGPAYEHINREWLPHSGYRDALCGAVEVYGEAFGPWAESRFEIRTAVVPVDGPARS